MAYQWTVYARGFFPSLYMYSGFTIVGGPHSRCREKCKCSGMKTGAFFKLAMNNSQSTGVYGPPKFRWVIAKMNTKTVAFTIFYISPSARLPGYLPTCGSVGAFPVRARLTLFQLSRNWRFPGVPYAGVSYEIVPKFILLMISVISLIPL